MLNLKFHPLFNLLPLFLFQVSTSGTQWDDVQLKFLKKVPTQQF